MSAPIISVTEDRVTVTANDTEANIRASAGFKEPDTDETADEKPESETPATPAVEGERNPDGTFKAKAEKPVDKPVEAKPDGDPRKSHQAKINLAIAKQREAERRAEDAERRANEREAELQALRQPKPSQPSEPAPKQPSYLSDAQRYQSHPDAPKLDDYVAANLDDPYASYQAAMAVFVADQRFAEREQRSAAERVQRERTTSTQTAFELAEQAHPGTQALLDAETRIYPPAVLNLIAEEAMRDPHLSAELVHHLVTHPDDAAVLAAQEHPIAAAREIGRLTARLSSAPSGPETVLSHTNAKPLIKPVRPSIMAPDTSAPDDLPFGPKYIAAMNERDRKAREARRG